MSTSNRRSGKMKMIIIVLIISLMISFKLGCWYNSNTSKELVVDHVISYKVSPDETLSSIASATKMTSEKDYRRQMREIQKMNSINGDYDIVTGQILQIPIYKWELKENIK